MAKRKNNTYWSKRLANAAWSTYNDTNKYHKELIQIYKKASEDLMLELFKMEAKFAKDGVIDRTAFYQANHLREMQKGFNSILEELGETVKTNGGETILKAGKKLIGTTAQVLNETGIQLKYNKELAKRLYQEPWKGATFSKRVWKNQDKLFKELNDKVKKGILTGKPVAQMAMDLNRTMDSKLYEASRLVRTETMHHLNAVGIESYKDAGVKRVQEVVTLDERTSEECAPHDGLIWDIDKAPKLPRHPNCRCVLVPYIDVDNGFDPVDVDEEEYIKFSNYCISHCTPDELNLINVHRTSEGIRGGYFQTPNSFRLNRAIREGKEDLLSEDDKKVINTLRNVIERVKTKDDYLLHRFDEVGVLDYYLNETPANLINNPKFKNKEITIDGFFSTSMIVEKNMFGGRPVQWEIRVPKGSNIFANGYVPESEAVINSDAVIRILNISDKNAKIFIEAVLLN